MKQMTILIRILIIPTKEYNNNYYDDNNNIKYIGNKNYQLRSKNKILVDKSLDMDLNF